MAVGGFSLSLNAAHRNERQHQHLITGLVTLSVCLPLETKTCVRTSEELKQRQLKQRCHEITTEDMLMVFLFMIKKSPCSSL